MPFRAAVYKDANELACDVTISERGKLVEARDCISNANVFLVQLRPYSKKLLADLGQLSDYKAEIEKLQKTAVVFGKYERGEGMSVFTIVAVGADPATHKPCIVAVYAWTILT